MDKQPKQDSVEKLFGEYRPRLQSFIRKQVAAWLYRVARNTPETEYMRSLVWKELEVALYLEFLDY